MLPRIVSLRKRGTSYLITVRWAKKQTFWQRLTKQPTETIDIRYHVNGSFVYQENTLFLDTQWKACDSGTSLLILELIHEFEIKENLHFYEAK